MSKHKRQKGGEKGGRQRDTERQKEFLSDFLYFSKKAKFFYSLCKIFNLIQSDMKLKMF